MRGKSIGADGRMKRCGFIGRIRRRIAVGKGAASAGLLVAAAVLGAAGPAEAAGLEPEQLYVGQDRAVWLRVEPPAWVSNAARLELALLAHDGAELRARVAVESGSVRIDESIPELWRLRRAVWLQLLADGKPIGSPLVVQPLLSRLVPIAEEAMSPGGYPYTRIVGWYDELNPPEDPARAGEDADDAEAEGVGGDIEAAGTEMEQLADSTEDEESGANQEGAAAPRIVNPFGASPWLANGEGEGAGDAVERLQSGLRIYEDRDVVLTTDKGAMRIALRPDMAPNTAWSFRHLAGGGFYRDVPFHRIVPFDREGRPFVIQAGDPTDTGSGGPGYWLPLERSGLAHDFGVVSMARDVPPDSAGSQFFICLSREGTARLDGNYTAFAEVVLGRETILGITDVELEDAATGRPVNPPMIESAELVAAPPRIPGVGRPDRRVQREKPGAAPQRKPR